jgi:hypothetical protein
MLGGPVATENLIRYELTHEISNHVIIPLHAGMVELLLHSLTSLESPPDDPTAGGRLAAAARQILQRRESSRSDC